MQERFLSESYGTLSETIEALVKSGYTHDFNIHQECLVCRQTNVTLSPDDFQIDKVYRFEGISNPEDQSVLYAISSAEFDVKGILVNGYGISSDETSSTLIEKLQTHREQILINTKSNDATRQRPEGNRILNASLLEIDLYKIIDQIKNESTWADSDRNSITIFKSDNMRIVLMGLHENAQLKPHKANGVISVQVLEGEINFLAGQTSSSIGKGNIVTLQENITHSVVALTDSFLLLTVSMNIK